MKISQCQHQILHIKHIRLKKPFYQLLNTHPKTRKQRNIIAAQWVTSEFIEQAVPGGTSSL